MTRTACCFLALGFSVAAFAAACGDDDDGGGGTGGNGGNGGTGGAGGTAGSAGSAGEAGTGNLAGAGGGVAGQGSGGNAGSTAGTAGSSAGTAGSGTVDPDGGVPDSGVVDEPDSGVVDPIVDAGGNQGPADSGVNGNCTGFTTGLLTFSEQSGQDFVISRVVFDPDGSAHVTIRTTIAAPFADPQQLCSGPEDDECVAIDDEINGARPAGTELVVDIDNVTADGGELAFMSALPSDLDAFPVAYVNWEDFESVDPDDGGPLDSLETLAATAGSGFWTAGESIALGINDNAIFVSGETNEAAGFGTCTADQF
ncbi:MAG: hypothetical protein ABI895_32965 [Deltaproteobacteria bacterium]